MPAHPTPPPARYRLGFLLCDHALDHLAADFGDYPQMFAAAFGEVSADIDWQVYDVTAGELPRDVAACDGYLISGSRHGTYDDLAWIGSLCGLIRDLAAAERPLVGLCFGHQVIAHALGGRVEKAAQGWGIGIHSYAVTDTAAWMTPALARVTIPVCHQDQVLSLPRGAVRLAGNDHCANFVVRFAPRILGIQGHPEFAPDFVRALIEWRREGLPAPTYAAASASLGNTPDNPLVKRWITNFLGITP